ncbi:MAG: hypothetical protein ACRC8F_05825 [Cetobacterium sp.]|uniref:hypothetical protein n=1 Tax=Cetobacterium TaxID=180162 RepID=UPI001F0528AC|nr:hypothetical protein [Cetobacterium somerae]UPO98940.1 hypothetical protein MKD34_13720 [Cetobacterium somerae]
MKKILLSLAILTIFTACGKEEVAPQEVIVEQTTVIEKVPTNSAIEAIEQSVVADVIEETSGDVIIPNSEIVSTEEIVETVAN